MSAKYGVNIELYNGSNNPYKINNERPIAIIGDDDKLAQGLHLYSDILEALKQVGKGSIKDTLEDLKATGLHSQIVLSVFKKQEDQDDESDENETQNNKFCTNAIDELKKCEATLGVKPKFFLAVGYNDNGVHEKLKQIAAYLRGVYAIELNEQSEDQINLKLQTYSTKTAIITYQKVIRVDKAVRPASAFIIALYAKTMSETEYGFSQSFSNRVIDGIIGIQDKVELIQGENCQADRLRDKGVTLIIANDGLRAWGGETCNDDLFGSIHTYVIFYTAIDTIFKAQARAIDKRMRDVLKNVVDSLEAFYLRLQNNNVVVGFEITIPKELNSNETISEGIVYIRHNVQEMPLIKRIVNRIYRVTDYSQKLIQEL
ncbi:phage tail protein [Campylobacter majalis]|uniref:phage tail protein n=1 Tax=Campylobacter majalis TaxID=2790656 RepID=UPI003D69AED9